MLKIYHLILRFQKCFGVGGRKREPRRYLNEKTSEDAAKYQEQAAATHYSNAFQNRNQERTAWLEDFPNTWVGLVLQGKRKRVLKTKRGNHGEKQNFSYLSKPN